MKPYYTDERTGILYKLIGDYYFPVGNRFGIADDGDEDVLEMLRSAADGQPTPHAGVFLGRFAEAGYRLKSAALLNMFPATAHFETIAVLAAR